MSKKIVAASFAIVLAVSIGFVVIAADQTPAQNSISWADQPGVRELDVISTKVIKSKEFEYTDGERGYNVNVMQDCWTTTPRDLGIDIELETYLFPPDSVAFVWKHKISGGCSLYVATVVGLPCENGKPPIAKRVAWIVPDIQFGFIQPGGEYLFTAVVGGIPEGTWDWFVVTECFDTNGGIAPPFKDGDIDDVIGANLGMISLPPIVYGPEPAEVLDPDPGGYPPGRLPGEEGACRCWCFTVEQPPECPSIEGDWVYFSDWDCDSLDVQITSIQFFADGTFIDGNGRGGTWTQDNCDVDWVFENGNHYWGVTTLEGTYMDGLMTSIGGQDGCWYALRE